MTKCIVGPPYGGLYPYRGITAVAINLCQSVLFGSISWDWKVLRTSYLVEVFIIFRQKGYGLKDQGVWLIGTMFTIDKHLA